MRWSAGLLVQHNRDANEMSDMMRKRNGRWRQRLLRPAAAIAGLVLIAFGGQAPATRALAGLTDSRRE